jgi:hypothetical protein
MTSGLPSNRVGHDEKGRISLPPFDGHGRLGAMSVEFRLRSVYLNKAGEVQW